jgi:hypothetical protein
MRHISTLLIAVAVCLFARPILAVGPNPDYGHSSQLDGFPIVNNEANDFAGAYVTPDADGNPRAPQACAPTATVNSFEMLQTRYGVTGLVGADPYDAINELADDMGTMGDEYYNEDSPNYRKVEDGEEVHTGGTTAAGLVNGKAEYIAEHQTGGPEIEIHGMAATPLFGGFDAGTNMEEGTPTATYIAQQLEMGQDLEIWEAWWNPTADMGNGAYQGAHIITVTGIDTVEGKIDFVDPFGEDGTANDVHADYDLHNGFVEIHYPTMDDGGDDPENPDNPAVEMQADIAMVVAESPVPEPAVLGLLVLTLTVARRRR